MSYHPLTTSDRIHIEIFHKEVLSTHKIRKQIGRHHSAISRELKRNENENDQAETAQTKYMTRRKACKPIGKYSKALAECIEEVLYRTYSPEQIANTITKGILSFKTIYRWIYQGLLTNRNLTVLRHKGKRHKPKETRGRFHIGKTISKRPKEVQKRTTFGHRELDTVVSSQGKSKGCFATLVERKTRFYFAIKIADLTAASMGSAIRLFVNMLPKTAFQTATVDRGKAFSCYTEIERDLGITVYFADPYSSWQSGGNENANGLLREFLPKNTNFNEVVEEDLQRALFFINSRPRKYLGWKSTYEVFLSELSQLT